MWRITSCQHPPMRSNLDSIKKALSLALISRVVLNHSQSTLPFALDGCHKQSSVCLQWRLGWTNRRAWICHNCSKAKWFNCIVGRVDNPHGHCFPAPYFIIQGNWLKRRRVCLNAATMPPSCHKTSKNISGFLSVP